MALLYFLDKVLYRQLLEATEWGVCEKERSLD